MSAPLQHVYPQWEPVEDERASEPGEMGLYWHGAMRVISRQRVRKLRRRGVPIMRKIDVTRRGRHRHAWFVEPTS